MHRSYLVGIRKKWCFANLVSSHLLSGVPRPVTYWLIWVSTSYLKANHLLLELALPPRGIHPSPSPFFTFLWAGLLLLVEQVVATLLLSILDTLSWATKSSYNMTSLTSPSPSYGDNQIYDSQAKTGVAVITFLSRFKGMKPIIFSPSFWYVQESSLWFQCSRVLW